MTASQRSFAGSAFHTNATVDPLILEYFERRFDEYMAENTDDDGAHDLAHLRRVWGNARTIAQTAGGDLLVILAACYFHDLVNVPKNHPDRSRVSSLSGLKAIGILKKQFSEFPSDYLEEVRHAIEAHSFSAGIEPRTLEARIVQDADRLEALGAMGLARVFYVAGSLKQQLFDPVDPLARYRPLDDKRFALDHFRNKLLKIQHSMRTDEGRRIARKNSDYLIEFAAKLCCESRGDMLGLDSDTINFLKQE